MSTALARPIDTLKTALAAPKMAAWLQKQMHASMTRNASQMINIIIQAATQNEFLAKCTPSSILANLCVAAQIGMVPNTALGHCWLVPFNNNKKIGGKWEKVMEAQLVIGYQGFVKLAYDAADLVVQAQPVYKGDEFEFDLASFPPVKYHRPGKEARTPDKLVNVWCHVKTPRGLVFGEVLTREEVEARRNVSKSYLDRDGNPSKNSPWVTNPAEMWRKTAVRHELKLAPKGNDERLERALEVDDLDVREQAVTSDIIDMSEIGDDVRRFDEQAEQAALPPASQDEIGKWAAEFATCDSMKALDEVAAKAPQHLRDALGRSYIDNSDRIRGGNGKRG